MSTQIEHAKIAYDAMMKVIPSMKLSNKGSTGDISNAFYGISQETKGGVKHLYEKQYPCHHHLRTGDEGERKPHSIYSVFVPPAGKTHQEAFKAYQSWILDDEVSPWRSLFKLQPPIEIEGNNITDHEFQKQYGFVFNNLNEIPSNLLMSFLIATRMPKEWPSFIKTWYKWVDEDGINPAVAMFYCSLFCKSSGDTCGSGIDSYFTHICTKKEAEQGKRCLCIAGTNKYDWPLDVLYAGDQYVINFIAGTPDKSALSAPYAIRSSPSKPINMIWGGRVYNRGEDGSYHHELIKRYMGKIGPNLKEMEAEWSEGQKGLAGWRYTGAINLNRMWRISYPELIELMKLEQERLLPRAVAKMRA